MSDLVSVLISMAVGIGMGALYFGGLWLTQRALPRSRYPERLFALSFLARTAVTAAALFTLAQSGNWRNVVTGLAGFVLLRTLVARRLSGPLEKASQERG